MRYLALVAVAATALVAAGVASGARAQQVAIHIDDHFQEEFLSDACGFDVFIDVVADLKVTLVYNRDGLVVREIDADFGSGRVTYRSPDTGNSFSFVFQRSEWDYGSGAVVGSDVIVSFTGLQGHVPGVLDTDAGLVRALGVVTGFDELGIPLVELVELLADRGNRNRGEEIFAAICSTLADP